MIINVYETIQELHSFLYEPCDTSVNLSLF